MHISKWMRKNSKKIMVFVVIFSMVSFVIGYTGLQIFFSLLGSDNPVRATLADGQKIRARDFTAAQTELRLLRMVGGDMILLSQGQQGLIGPLLAHLLFPDSQAVAQAQLPIGLKQAAQRGQIPVSPDVVEEFFNEQAPSELVWILLKTEARNAGSIISDDMARNILQNIIPQLAKGIDANRYVQSVISQTGLTEGQIVRTFAELLGVMFYANNVINTQDVTLNQINTMMGRNYEKFNADFVKIPAEWFIDPNSPVDSDEMKAQFEAFKTVLPGSFSEENPYGFGYKLPKRVQLEFMTVLLDDVKTKITPPTNEQLEEYYTRHIEQFRYQEPADPNDPEGEQITKTRSYAESLPQIRNMIEQERIRNLANQIFNDAKAIIEKDFATLNLEQANLEDLQKAAGDYLKTAQDLSQRYNIPIQTGKTGLLSPVDFARDSILQTFRLQFGQRRLPLSEVVFNVRLDPAEPHRIIGVPMVRPWENIGPMAGMTYDFEAGKTYQLMTMVRVIDVRPQEIPESMDITYDATGMIVLESQREEKTKTFSLAEQIAADIRLAGAMKKAQAVAETLTALIEQHGWDEAIALFNENHKAEYGTPDISLQTVTGQTRMAQNEIEQIILYMAANPGSGEFIKDRLRTNVLNEQLHSLLENGQDSTGTIIKPLVVPQTRAAYVVKEVSRLPATEQDYLDNKAMTALQLDMESTAEPALIHWNVKNLMKRLGYQQVEDARSAVPAEPMNGDAEE